MKKYLFLFLSLLAIISTPEYSFAFKAADGENNVQTFVLSNEAPGYLITQLVNAGYGNYNLYETLVTIQQSTNPGIGDIITPQFLNTLISQPATGSIFTTLLKNVNVGNQGIAINSDGSFQVVNISGSTYYGMSGTATKVAGISGVGNGNFTHATTSSPLTSWISGETIYNVFALGWGEAAPAITIQPANTKVRMGSNASFRVVATGAPATFSYLWQRKPSGNSTWADLSEGSPYTGAHSDTLTVSNTTPVMTGDRFRCIVSNGVSPDAISNTALLNVIINVNQSTFVISNEAPGHLITRLVDAGYGNYNLYQTLVQIGKESNPSISGILTPNFLSSLQNAPASAEIFTTLLKDVSTKGVSVSISTDGTARYDDILGEPYYTTFPTMVSNISGVESTNLTYSTDPLVPLNATVIDGPLAGMTTTYIAFAVAWGNVAPVITKQPANKTVYAGTVNVANHASFTVAASGAPATFSYHWQRLPKGNSTWADLSEGNPYTGTRTDSLTVSNTTTAMSGDQFRCTVSNGVSPDAISNAAKLTVMQTINVNQDTFIISNEAPGYLITHLVRSGYGYDNLYQTLVDMVGNSNPSVSGIVIPPFLQALKNCPASSDIFTTLLKDVNPKGVTVSISTDGSTRYDSILGNTYYGTFPTLVTYISGVDGTANFTHSTDSPLNSKLVDGPLLGMTTTYNVFAIGWSSSTVGIPDIKAISDSPYVFPNPFKGGFYVRNLPEDTRLKIYDMQGKLVYRSETVFDRFIQPGSMRKGIYILRLMNSQGTWQQKIVKN